MGARSAAVIAAGVVASILLAGCAESRSAPAGGLSSDELAAYRDYVGGQMWDLTGLPAELRPEVQPQIVGVEQWSSALGACEHLAHQGEASGASPQDIVVSEYQCRMKYQLSGADLGLLNEAQLDYLYDYYQDTLVPCLLTRGVDLPVVLTRDEAVDVGRFGALPWNPYSEIARFDVGILDEAGILDACPAFPSDAVFDRYWRY